jgi:hypothetical protein
MSAIDTNTEQQAVTRLFDLVRTGEVDNIEFAQLDSLIYERLLQTYDCGREYGSAESIS